MYYNNKDFEREIDAMKRFGKLLMPYNFPLVSPEEEEAVNFIKSLHETCVDGYSLVLHFSKSDYGTHYLETLQVVGKYSPFLPFSLVCKIGKQVFGSRHLSLVELIKEGRKIYCWTLVADRENKPIPGPYQQEDAERCMYEGLEYRSVSPKEVNLY